LKVNIPKAAAGVSISKISSDRDFPAEFL